MAAILATIIASLVEGSSAATVFGALTAGQWGTLIGGAGAELEPEIAKLFGLKPAYSSLGALVDAVVKAATDDVTKQELGKWLSANADKAMQLQPGISSDT